MIKYEKPLCRLWRWPFTVVAVFGLLSACQNASTAAEENDSTEVRISVTETISKERDTVSSKPVGSYEAKVPDEFNNWWFRVKLYETKERFKYRVTMQYQEVTGEDEINFPNLGMDPKPVLKKGKADYSCIIGFMDNKGTFREYKEVAVKNEALKITTIKHYAVYAK